MKLQNEVIIYCKRIYNLILKSKIIDNKNQRDEKTIRNILINKTINDDNKRIERIIKEIKDVEAIKDIGIKKRK